MKPSPKIHLTNPTTHHSFCGKPHIFPFEFTQEFFLAIPYSIRCQDCERRYFSSLARPVPRPKPRLIPSAQQPVPPAPASQCTEDTTTQAQARPEEIHHDNQDTPISA